MVSPASAHFSRGLFYFIAIILFTAPLAGFLRAPAMVSLYACSITVVFCVCLLLRGAVVDRRSDLPAVLFVAVCWLSSLSLIANPEVRGALAALLAALELGFLIRYLTPDDRARISVVVVGTAAVVAVMLGGAIVFPDRLAAIVVNANICAGYILFGFVLSVTQLRMRVYQFLSGLLLLAIIVSGSRTALLAGILTAGIYWWRHMPRPARWGYIAVVTAGCLFIINGIASDSSLLNRLSWWQAGWRMFIDHPLFGSGWGSFGSQYLIYRPVVTENTAYAHNGLVQLLAEGGLAGTLLFVWFLISRCAGADRLSPAAAAAGAFLVFNLFDYAGYIPAHLITFFVLMFSIQSDHGGRNYDVPLIARAGIASLAAVSCLIALPARGTSPAVYAAQSEAAFRQYLLTRDAALFARAIEQQELAVCAAPDTAVYHADLAWLYRTAGNTEAARREILAALRGDPLNVRFQSAVRSLIPPR